MWAKISTGSVTDSTHSRRRRLTVTGSSTMAVHGLSSPWSSQAKPPDDQHTSVTKLTSVNAVHSASLHYQPRVCEFAGRKPRRICDQSRWHWRDYRQAKRARMGAIESGFSSRLRVFSIRVLDNGAAGGHTLCSGQQKIFQRNRGHKPSPRYESMKLWIF